MEVTLLWWCLECFTKSDTLFCGREQSTRWLTRTDVMRKRGSSLSLITRMFIRDSKLYSSQFKQWCQSHFTCIHRVSSKMLPRSDSALLKRVCVPFYQPHVRIPNGLVIGEAKWHIVTHTSFCVVTFMMPSPESLIIYLLHQPKCKNSIL